jgi:hypothetical protein
MNRLLSDFLAFSMVCVVLSGCQPGGEQSAAPASAGSSAGETESTTIPVVFSGGYDTDPRDGGRPVTLIAGALGVTPEQFREAFSGVTPSRDGPPTGDEARSNKEALLRVLGPLGIANDRLDDVSDQYRYQPQRGELWPTEAAEAHAEIVDGKVGRIVVTKPGAGYNSVPTARLEGRDDIVLTVRLSYSPDFDANGSVAGIDVVEATSTNE